MFCCTLACQLIADLAHLYNVNLIHKTLLQNVIDFNDLLHLLHSLCFWVVADIRKFFYITLIYCTFYKLYNKKVLVCHDKCLYLLILLTRVLQTMIYGYLPPLMVSCCFSSDLECYCVWLASWLVCLVGKRLAASGWWYYWATAASALGESRHCTS